MVRGKLDLEDPEQMQDFCNNIAVAKLISEELGENPSYEKIVRISDELDLTVADVHAYMKLYQYLQTQMIL